MLIRKPQIIIISGHPGSGKSTLANRLSDKLNWPVLSVEQVHQGLASLAQPFEILQQAATVAVVRQVEQAAMNSNRVIVDLASNLKREWPKFDAVRVRWPHVKFLPLFLLGDLDTSEAQLVDRIAANPDDFRKKYDREKFAGEFELYSDFEFKGLIKMEARRPKEDILKNAVALIYANLLT